MNIYLRLTEEFNTGRLRAVIASGQAVVLHKLAITSKDGDWILREDQESLDHVLHTLELHGAHYRFGAPLDLHWLRCGWSSHFEFSQEGLRVRADFFTRPPRLTPDTLASIWQTQEGRNPPFISLVELAEMKKTNREKDFAIIGELARKMSGLQEQIFYSRSARDLLKLKETYPEVWEEVQKKRDILTSATQGREALEIALDAERRQMMRLNEARLEVYENAAQQWAGRWPLLIKTLHHLLFRQAHDVITAEAAQILPFDPYGNPTI